MDPSVSEHDPLAVLADEFLDRCRRGERITPEDYARLHPELASQILDVFPALMVMENLGGADADAPEPSPVPCPLRLGEYRILREVGRGGMGVVYEAIQETLGRHVALKVLPALAAGQGTFLERFRREAKAAARLHHTHIVPVFGVGEHEGTHFYAMQFIHGQGLDRVLDDVRRLRAGTTERDVLPGASLAQSLVTACYQPAQPAEETAPVPTKPDRTPAHSGSLARVDRYHLEVARLGAQAAEALAYAHSQGVLHRDVKPSNLLLDAEGNVWISDFGLAKADDSEDLTNTGDIVGTLRYMAPERFDGKGDVRSDVYGLGVTLFEMLALRPAFEERDRAALIRHITQEGAPSLKQFAPSVPRDLQTVVEKAAARESADRYQSATELAEDLRRILADQPIRARRQRTTERVRRWARRNPSLASLGVVVGVLVLALLAGGIVHNVRLEGALENESKQRKRAEEAEREGRLKLFESRVAEARASRHSRRVGQRFGTLKAIRDAVSLARELELPAERFDELRNLAIAALALPDLKPDEAWVNYPDDMTEMWNWGTGGEVSPDGRLTAFVDRHGAVRVQRVTSGPEKGEVVARLKGLGREVSCDWSSDSRYLAVWQHVAPSQLQVWRTDDFTLVIDTAGANPNGSTFSPDGRLLIASGPTAIRVYDLPTGKVVRFLPPRAVSGALTGLVAHHPHRSELAHSSSTGILILNSSDGKEITRLPTTGQATHLAWHPHGELLGVAFHDRVEIWDVGRKRRNHQFRHHGEGLRIYFNQTGDLLAVNGWASRVRLWNPYSGREVLTTSGLTAGFRAGDGLTSFFPNETSPRQSPLTIVEPARECRTLVAGVGLPGESAYTSCRVHPGGRLLAIATNRGVGLIDLETGSERGFLPGFCQHIVVEPGGSLVTKMLTGLFRWPVSVEGDRYRVGPPQRIPVPVQSETVARSADGELLAASTMEGAYVWHRDRPREARLIGPNPDCRHVALSPDGKLVATGSWNAEGLRVWDVESGKLIRTLIPNTPMTVPVFSPDGKWLWNSKGPCWRVSDWTEGPMPLTGAYGVTFSPNERLAACGGRKGFVLLVDPETGRELARLEDPAQDGSHTLLFTPDGTALIALTPDSACARVWDLRLIRKGLVELGLDWDAPPYPPATELPPDRPLQVEVVGAHLLGDPAKPEESRRQQAVAALFFNPFDAEAHEVLGRDLFTRRRYAEALAHLGAAGSFQHHQNSVWYLRGASAYYLNRWAEARADFTRHLNWRPEDGEAFLFRGIVLERLGEHRLAVADLTEALRFGVRNTPYAYELRGNNRLALKQLAGAADDFEASLKIQPDNVRVLLPFAILRANGPEGVRDLPAAIRLAERVVKLLPKDAVCHRALGIALYRAKKYDEASASLRKSLELGTRTTSPIATLYFLAMCQAGSGDLDAAKKTFAEAASLRVEATWPASLRDRLKEIREEAEQMLRSAQNK